MVTISAATNLTAKFEKRATEDVIAETVAASVKTSENTYKVGLAFDSINPAEYTNIVFKAVVDGEAQYKGGAVDSVLGGVYDGPVQLAIILENAPSDDVSVLFTNTAID